MIITEITEGFIIYIEQNPNFTGILRNTMNNHVCTGYHKNGKKHREDGPAYYRDDGEKAWYLNGKNYSKAEYDHALINLRMKRIANR